MSHFTTIRTEFKNLDYLKNALTQLSITYQEIFINSQASEEVRKSLKITQKNNSDILFLYKKDHYCLTFDESFWKQSVSVNNFLKNVSKKYTEEIIVQEAKKQGYKLINYQTEKTGVSKITVQHWKS